MLLLKLTNQFDRADAARPFRVMCQPARLQKALQTISTEAAQTFGTTAQRIARFEPAAMRS